MRVAVVVLVVGAAACREPVDVLESGHDLRCEGARPTLPSGVPLTVSETPVPLPGGFAVGTTRWQRSGEQLRSSTLERPVRASRVEGGEAVIADERGVTLLRADGSVQTCAREAWIGSVGLTRGFVWWSKRTLGSSELMRAPRTDCAAATVVAHDSYALEKLGFAGELPFAERAGGVLVSWSEEGAPVARSAVPERLLELCSGEESLLVLTEDGVFLESAHGGRTRLASLSRPVLWSTCDEGNLLVGLGPSLSRTTVLRIDQGGTLTTRELEGKVTLARDEWMVVDGLVRDRAGVPLLADARHVRAVWASGATALVTQPNGRSLRWDGAAWSRDFTLRPAAFIGELPDGDGGLLDLVRVEGGVEVRSGREAVAFVPLRAGQPTQARSWFSDPCTGDLVIEVGGELVTRHAGRWKRVTPPVPFVAVWLDGNWLRLTTNATEEFVHSLSGGGWHEEPVARPGLPSSGVGLAVGAAVAVDSGRGVEVLRPGDAPLLLDGARLLGASAPWLIVETAGSLEAVRVLPAPH